MKLILADEHVKLEKTTEETNAMLGSLEVSSLEAEKEAEKVSCAAGRVVRRGGVCLLSVV